MVVASFPPGRHSPSLMPLQSRMFPPQALQETSHRASEMPHSPAPLLPGLWNNAETPQPPPPPQKTTSPLLSLYLPSLLTHSPHLYWWRAREGVKNLSPLPWDGFLSPLSCSSHLGYGDAATESSLRRNSVGSNPMVVTNFSWNFAFEP